MKNNDLDFADFAAKVIKSVDDIRSFGTNNDGIPNVSSSKPTESRINAFYRLIGLPSVILDEDNVALSSRVDSLNSGNQFKASDVFGADFIKQTAEHKATRESMYLLKVTDAEAKAFLNQNINKLNNGACDIYTKKKGAYRHRGLLFPMVVFGDITIFPQDRRVADAFMTKQDRTVDVYEYKAPLIESIVLIRLKGDGVFDANLQSQLQNDFGIDASQLNAIETMFIDNITKSTNTVSTRLAKVAADINEISTKTKKYPQAKADLVAEIRQEFKTDDSSSGKIDTMSSKEAAAQRLKQSAMFLIEYDNENSAINAKDSALMSELLSLVGNQAQTDGRSGKINTTHEQNQKNLDAEIEKTMQRARAAFRELESLLGTFSGLSGVDVIVIIEALFTIPIDKLIGLLNDEARVRLSKLRKVESNVAVKDALQALEFAIIQIYNRLIINVLNRKVRNSESNKKG